MSERESSGQAAGPATARRSPRGPNCEACGVPTALTRFAPLPTLLHHELRTYACPQCGREETLSAPEPKAG